MLTPAPFCTGKNLADVRPHSRINYHNLLHRPLYGLQRRRPLHSPHHRCRLRRFSLSCYLARADSRAGGHHSFWVRHRIHQCHGPVWRDCWSPCLQHCVRPDISRVVWHLLSVLGCGDIREPGVVVFGAPERSQGFGASWGPRMTRWAFSIERKKTSNTIHLAIPCAPLVNRLGQVLDLQNSKFQR